MPNWPADGLILLAGMAIGATSIGGVAVVPVLSGIAGVPLPQAIAASSLAFLPTGLLGWCAARREAKVWHTSWPLHTAALIGALAGATAVHSLPPGAARIGLALLTAASGLYGLVSAAAATSPERPMPGQAALFALGLGVGFASALSGTGGPVLLLPLLILWRAPTVTAVAAAMAIQLPVAVAASAAHMLAGQLPVALGVQTGVILLAGAWAGRLVTRRLPGRALRLGTSLCLIAVAGWYGLSHWSP
ncbi:sulfite exporter TauE/SafE family protein [Cupriavidus necator]|uniref:Probable membrane transporter protein n=1 Tax=Cupriavidus necator TaxID=106590 RepID=A0A367PK68_CUPNE|nr:sulfite exporter TauE/SafE family protein [Cupriavidus necator]QQX82844.1 sulfite exporter TauE/SafE family protein [Cupriavidus necator]RCJ07416.1 sulfite exporter TauE/SafE family protein [Cupriavidus necator]